MEGGIDGCQSDHCRGQGSTSPRPTLLKGRGTGRTYQPPSLLSRRRCKVLTVTVRSQDRLRDCSPTPMSRRSCKALRVIVRARHWRRGQAEGPFRGRVKGRGTERGHGLPPPPGSHRQWQIGGRQHDGDGTAQQRCPMLTRCEEHDAPACRACTEHNGVRFCCQRGHGVHGAWRLM